jgi:hypothetical protein
MPAFAIADGARYAVDSEVLGELATWYGNANLVLGETRKRLVARELDAPPVRCWPHHFDLDTLIYLHRDEPVRTMGVGFSPGDEYYDEPYFYVSMHPEPDVAMLPPLPMIAHWHAQDFTAVIAPASRIVASKDQRAEVEGYLTVAIEAAIGVLSQAKLTSDTAR